MSLLNACTKWTGIVVTHIQSLCNTVSRSRVLWPDTCTKTILHIICSSNGLEKTEKEKERERVWHTKMKECSPNWEGLQNEWQFTYLFFSFEGNNASKWSKHFLPHQPALVWNIRDDNWTHEVTLQREREKEQESQMESKSETKKAERKTIWHFYSCQVRPALLDHSECYTLLVGLAPHSSSPEEPRQQHDKKKTARERQRKEQERWKRQDAGCSQLKKAKGFPNLCEMLLTYERTHHVVGVRRVPHLNLPDVFIGTCWRRREGGKERK